MTQEQFNQNYGRIAMPKPFAHDGLITPIVDIGDSTHPVNFADGFPSEYSAPHSQGGKYVTRGEFNAIGNLATRNDFYKMCGGLNTFNPELASKIGGYPKGAILQLLDRNVLKYVISLVDNNSVNFNTAGVDGVNWMFCYESKHDVDEKEGFLDHVELSNLTTDTNYSTNVYVKYSPKSGFVNLRNVKCEFDSDIESENQFRFPFLCGSGIMVKAFSNPETIHPLYAGGTQSDWDNWRSSRTLRTGSMNVAGTRYVENFFGAIQSDDNPPQTISPTNGLITINSGEYIAIDVINGYFNVYTETAIVGVFDKTATIKSLSFDIYIV